MNNITTRQTHTCTLKCLQVLYSVSKTLMFRKSLYVQRYLPPFSRLLALFSSLRVVCYPAATVTSKSDPSVDGGEEWVVQPQTHTAASAITGSLTLVAVCTLS